MRPLLHAWLQERKARVQRLVHQVGSRASFGFLIALTAVAALLAVNLVASSSFAHEAIEWMADHRVIAAIGGGIYTLLLVRRLRLRLALEHARSWLRALPISSRSFAGMTALRTSMTVVAHVSLLSGIVVFGAIAADQSLASTLSPLLCGLLIGTILGAISPQSAAAQPSSERSRFILRVRRPERAASLDGLSKWPIAHALAWHRPENSRFLFIAAALSVPVGSSAVLGLAILATWSLASYLFALARAISEVAREAALWLRPTSVPFRSFAWAITRRVLVHQVIGLTLLGGIATAAGGTIRSAVYFCAMWLLIASMIAMINLRQRFFSMSSLVRSVVAAVVVLAAESRVRGWGGAVAIAVLFFHLREPSRVRT
jgi:hypothetical protein